MKIKLFITGILSILLVFSLSLAGCDDNTSSTYTVTFNANNGTGTVPAIQTVNAGSSITLPNEGGLTRTGHTFGGWNTNASGTGTNYSAGSSYTVTDNITLFARWLPVGTTTFIVTFNANGATNGIAPAAMTANSGSSITLPGNSRNIYSGFL